VDVLGLVHRDEAKHLASCPRPQGRDQVAGIVPVDEASQLHRSNPVAVAVDGLVQLLMDPLGQLDAEGGPA